MNILVVRTDKLGDFITSLPAMYALKQHSPKNRIIACVAPLNKELALACTSSLVEGGFIDEVIVDDGLGLWSLVKKLRHVQADVSITLFSNTRVALAQFLAGIPKRIAPATKIAQIFYTDRVKQRRSEVKMAEFEYNLELTKALFPSINLEYKKPLLAFSDSKNIYELFCTNYNIDKEIIAFHVGFGGSSDANWNLDEYEILIRAVLKQEKYQVVLTFGPDEVKLCEEMQGRLQKEAVLFYISTEGIVNFAKLISNFKLFVSTSTGTFHLASLVGTPTMTFFAASLFASSKRWKGVGDEKLQQNFMIPHAKDERVKLFESVKKRLSAV
ncbi:MAG: glycosyltransferase family 9 protein [Epsilonproteobacteria bacterium]|nr:glycosyltransferase family 9 protein [Campylobacterota bacterium]OIO15982.1 MAG: heptosyltransferase [Helicobacteraceae bacterium CG1_02_36_14]PIP10578.1 MAG: heptosyltransferase [Sulfurimonas sp. CG23_combo_of_CG06-09_8_20_14_all_36_33]PIS24310.1 MAG: heptosyltransferase [Sulfurimonas sp. CG08_land_8_20_14_0_20_36_33]PIU36242.1 MAG: heptosyltransferase [Sulfurimonas sp. CG07_land_8_20_14_0_80_36_56]PIV04261.1 MAG: heptosyltransferase [Sulfurimonas sp. CG03_land_8_20_14_0_80_36_25]PIV36330